MPGHRHIGGSDTTQNQGNVLGDRPCVRQSMLYRQHCGGNAMKEMMGQSQLAWSTTHQEGVYAGKRVFNHNAQPAAAAAVVFVQPADARPQRAHVERGEAPPQQPFQPVPLSSSRRGAGAANRQTFSVFGP